MENNEHESLGENVIPKNYKLFFEPDFGSFKSNGHEEISVFVKEATDMIRLNAKELQILKVSALVGGREIAGAVKDIPQKQIIEISFQEKIKGEIKLRIEFIADNNDRMYGLSRSKYEVDSKEEYLLSSQFEATDARAAFPCIDEPEFKATFDLSLKIDKGLEAISNMPKKTEKMDGKKKIVTFDTTPIMSTYLLYIGIGKYDVLSGSLGKLKINVITTRGKKKYANTALEDAKKVVKYFEDYFGIKYPLPKLDLIAVPDFANGAMENWGAITFREIYLLLDEKSSTTMRRQIAEIIAHELAHQWFGDLVTMKWWNDIWLNESFATFMSYKAMDAIFPEWKVWLEYMLYAFNSAFSTDGLKVTHPISVHVQTADEIEEIFDVISYRKGGSVLHMLEDYVGKETFREGLHIYLEKNAYRNATKFDLWNSIEKAAVKDGKKLDVPELMSAWVEKIGYPVVHVSAKNDLFTLKQNRFLFSGEMEDTWPLPVHYKTQNNDKIILMKGYESLIRENSDWIKLNYGQHGLYRVIYEDSMLEKLGGLIKKGVLSAEDAWGIENDLFSILRGGGLDTSKYLDFIGRFCTGLKYPLSEGVIMHLAWLYSINYNRPLAEKVRETGINFGADILKKIGWDSKKAESDIVKMTRIDVIALLNILKDVNVTKRLLLMFEEAKKKRNKIDPDMLGNVYAAAALNVDKKTFDELIKLYRDATSPNERIFILLALGKLRDPAMLLKALDFQKSKDVRPHDSCVVSLSAAYNQFSFGQYAASNPISEKVLVKWLKANWKDIIKKFDPATKIANKQLISLVCVTNPTLAKDIANFFSAEGNFRDDLKYPLGQTLEAIELNIGYLKNN